MIKRMLFAGVAGLLAVAAGVAVANTELVALPATYKTDYIRYATVDREDLKQVRDLYAPRAALAAAQATGVLPSGTTLVMEIFGAQLDAAQNPVKGADGRMQKAALANIFVMEKRTGWGTQYPAATRNGEWEYARFTPAGGRHDDRNMTGCFQCHTRVAASDYLFSLPAMRMAR
jgi:Cytochrome P460